MSGPSSFSDLRIGETIHAIIDPRDADGERTTPFNAAFSLVAAQAGNLQLTQNTGTLATLTAVGPPGFQDVKWTAQDPLGNVVTKTQRVTVLDGSLLVLKVTRAENCSVAVVNGQVEVLLNSGGGTPKFDITAVVDDARGNTPVTYALTDNPDWTADHGHVSFNPAANAVTTTATVLSPGVETIHAVAITDDTNTTIHGQLDVHIKGLASGTFVWAP